MPYRKINAFTNTRPEPGYTEQSGCMPEGKQTAPLTFGCLPEEHRLFVGEFLQQGNNMSKVPAHVACARDKNATCQGCELGLWRAASGGWRAGPSRAHLEPDYTRPRASSTRLEGRLRAPSRLVYYVQTRAEAREPRQQGAAAKHVVIDGAFQTTSRKYSALRQRTAPVPLVGWGDTGCSHPARLISTTARLPRVCRLQV